MTGTPARLGLGILVASQVLTVVLSLRMLVWPSALPRPWLRSGDAEVLVRAWAVTWLVLGAVLLVVLLTGFRRGEPAARLVMVAVPAVWLAHFLLAPGTAVNLALAVLTAGALVATLRHRPSASRAAPAVPVPGPGLDS